MVHGTDGVKMAAGNCADAEFDGLNLIPPSDAAA
jgi:hypothetical protein